MRYVSAFFRAVQMTAKGESLTPPHFRPLEEWIALGLQKLNLLEQLADANGLSSEQREEIELKIDGRQMTMGRILLMLRHNFQTEYPRLIKFNDDFSPIVIQSSNFNDQYRIQRLLDAHIVTEPNIYTALQDLSEHLYQLPEVKKESKL